MGAAEPADLTLHAALLVRALDARATEEPVETVVAAQRDEPLRLGPVPPAQHPDHRRFEVVVADPGRHRAQVREGAHVPLQERFLCLGGERDVKRLA